MSSAREDISTARNTLFVAKHKTEEMERELEKAQADKVAWRQLLEQEETLHSLLKKDWEKLQKELAEARSLISREQPRTYKTMTELKDQVDALKLDNIELARSLDSYKIQNENQKTSLRTLNSLVGRSTEERDHILSQIRQVLGAKDRTSDNPHETALQAAKRVMEKVGRQDEMIKEQARENAILRNGRPPKDEIWVNTLAYAALLRDSNDLKVIKEKLGIDSTGANPL